MEKMAAGVLLDVDGTLVESNYFHVVAWRRAFEDAGLDVPMFKIHRLIGMGSDRFLPELIGRFDAGLDAGHSRHYKSFEPNLKAFAKVPELLKAMSARGARLILASSAKAEQMDHLRVLIGAQDCIDEVVCADDVEESKPAPDIFLTAMKKAGLDPEKTIALGDSVWDVKAAKNCGVGCVALLSGGNSSEDLIKAGAVALYEDAEDLLRQLDASPIGRLLNDQAVD